MKILVVVDMQNDFIDGVLGTPEAQAIVPKVVEKIKTFDGAVFLTQDTHFENYLDTLEGKNLPVPHCIFDTDGWELNPLIREALNSIFKTNWLFNDCVLKISFGSVHMAAQFQRLHEIYDLESIEFIGVCTDICVISNVLLTKAHLPDVPIIVDASCCAGVTPETHKNALAAMKQCQIIVTNEE